jgi:COMPASS component SDC1
MPAEAPPHGAPTRQYLNTKVTGALLEGMKILAREQ